MLCRFCISSVLFAVFSFELLLVFFFSFFLSPLHLPFAAAATSFHYPNFVPASKGICLEGDASIDETAAAIQLNVVTPEGYSLGRAYRCQPIRLWDANSKELSSFSTKFSFGVTFGVGGTYGVAGGMAFFLSQDRRIPPRSTGSYLGMVSADNVFSASGSSRFVAVEFDSYPSPWDPMRSSCHIGIDVNSLRSVEYAEMVGTNFTPGPIGTALVFYNSSSKELNVQVHYNENVYELAYVVDLRNYISEWVYVGFSGTTGSSWDLKKTTWGFNSTLDSTTGCNNRTKLIIEITVPLCVVMIGLTCFAIWKCMTKRRRISGKNPKDLESNCEKGDPAGLEINSPAKRCSSRENYYENTFAKEEFDKVGPRSIPFEHIVTATENFKEERKLGSGASGVVYCGHLGYLFREVAIKRITKDFINGKKEFINEIKIISRLRHRNLVQLMGWCHEGRELLIVYEFMPNRSLDYHLFDDTQVLPWPHRYNIAKGVASALLYLHEGWDQCIVHRDLKSSNIMLDPDFNAKVGDFGLSRITDHGAALRSTMMAGTLAYMAPECFVTGKASKETDVYSFGVVVLEIACGRMAVDPAEKGRENLIKWLWKLYEKGAVMDAVDKKLEMAFDKREMERLMLVGLWCVYPEAHVRPSCSLIVTALNFDVPVPDLDIKPAKAPVLPYMLSFGASSSSATTRSHDGCDRNSSAITGTSVSSC